MKQNIKSRVRPKTPLVPAYDVSVGDAIYTEAYPEPVVVTDVQDWSSDAALIHLIYRTPDDRQGWALVPRLGLVSVASGWERPAVRLPLATRVALRGAPFGALIAALAIVGAVLHVPSGGGIAFLIVVLWLAGCVAMVTTPEDPR